MEHVEIYKENGMPETMELVTIPDVSERDRKAVVILGQLTRTMITPDALRARTALKMMLGTDFIRIIPADDAHDTGIFFMFKGSRKYRAASIVLDYNDEYTFTFYAVRAGKVTEKVVRAGCYCDDLTEIFWDVTGLAVTVPTFKRA